MTNAESLERLAVVAFETVPDARPHTVLSDVARELVRNAATELRTQSAKLALAERTIELLHSEPHSEAAQAAYREWKKG